jgi:hypothetical protein
MWIGGAIITIGVIIILNHAIQNKRSPVKQLQKSKRNTDEKKRKI